LSRLRIIAAPILLLMIALSLTGCSRAATVEYIPEGGRYTLSELEAVARSVDISPLEDLAPEAITETRQTYLASLRGHGDKASRVADVLTRDFPPATAAVPLLVEGAEVDGRMVWIIVEAWAEENGPLTHRRLWLLDQATYGLVDSISLR